MPHDLKSWHLKKILCILYCTTQGTNIPTTPASDRIPGSTRTMLCFNYHPKTLLFLWTFGSHPMTPHIFVFFSHWMPKIMLSPNDPSFFEPVLSPNAPACWRAGLTPVSTSYLTAPRVNSMRILEDFYQLIRAAKD